LSSLEFKVNDYLKLKLEGSKTFIYVAEERFRYCQIAILNIPALGLYPLKEFESMDEILNFYEKNVNFQHEKEVKIISPIEEFWVHCSSIHVWAENNYNTAFLDSYLAFPLLKRLVEAGDFNAEIVFKEEIAKRLNSKVPQVIRYLLLENYDSFLNQEEIIYAVLNVEEAIALEAVSKRINKRYNLVFNFDDLREKFFNIHRGKGELQDNQYYFSAYNGNLDELELILDNNCTYLPSEVKKFTKLRRLYLYINDLSDIIPEFDIQLEAVSHLKIFCFGKVKIPKILHAFPNLELIEIYSDAPSQVIVDDDALKKVIIRRL
jgi:hypothetical protein